MNSSSLSLWRIRAMAILLAVVGAAALFFVSATSALAANTINFSTYADASPAEGDGTVDRIKWVFDENVTACAYEAGDWTVNTAGTINVTAITSLNCSGSSPLLNIIVTAGTGVTGGESGPVISYANVGTAGSVTLTSGALTAKASQATTDEAAPQIKTFTYQDADTDGKIDTMLVTFTEVVDGASVLSQNDLTLTAVGDFTALAFGTASVDLITGAMASVSVPLGTESSAEDTAEGAGTIAITSQNAFSLTDSLNTNAFLRAQSVAGATFLDGAGPILLDTTPNANTSGILSVSDVVLTFSEPINVASDTIALSPNVSRTETWSVGNTVLTLDGVWAAGRNTVTFTAAPAATGSVTTFAGAQAGDSTVASPLVYNVSVNSDDGAISDSTTVGGGSSSYGVTLLSPNGGEEYMPGDHVDITWETEGPTAVGGININFVYMRNGATYQSTLVSGSANDGSYIWTVPEVDTDSASIQVSATDLVETLATDSSDEEFTIGYPSDESEDDGSEPSDEVTTPSTGETGVSPVTGEMEEISEVEAGMYVRSSYFSTVYYIEENASGALVRRPFTDTQTFMTWQSNWSRVETVTDATLPTLSLGSPMLPKSGVVLVKIQSNAKVYAIEGGNALRWLSDEDVAIAMYGSDWADYVIDVPVTLFGRFEIGDDIDSVEDVNMGTMKTRVAVNS